MNGVLLYPRAVTTQKFETSPFKLRNNYPTDSHVLSIARPTTSFQHFQRNQTFISKRWKGDDRILKKKADKPKGEGGDAAAAASSAKAAEEKKKEEQKKRKAPKERKPKPDVYNLFKQAEMNIKRTRREDVPVWFIIECKKFAEGMWHTIGTSEIDMEKDPKFYRRKAAKLKIFNANMRKTNKIVGHDDEEEGGEDEEEEGEEGEGEEGEGADDDE